MKTLLSGLIVAFSYFWSPLALAQVTDGVVKIGVLNDMTSLYSDLGGKGSLLAAEMAVVDFGGKVLGKPIELISADHQNKPDVGSAIARRWIDTEQVDAIVDLPTSSVVMAVVQFMKERKRIALLSGPASSDLTGKACTPYTVHWTYDTYALAHGTGTAMTKGGGDTWFFLTADYAFGHALERDTTAAVKAAGGTVVGSVRVPLNTPDFSSFLLRAQTSGSKVIALATGGGDTISALKQAAEFGMNSGKQSMAGLLVYLTDVHAIGLETAQGLTTTTSFYWDQNDETRAFSKRFMSRNNGVPPTEVQAGVYGATLFYLKAIENAGTDDSDAVMTMMRKTPINDFMTRNGILREDGRVIRDMYSARVKAPKSSKYPWDYFDIIATIPGANAFRPLEGSECPLIKKQ